MGKEDVIKVNRILPDATSIAVHLEALNHSTLSRMELAKFARGQGISDKVIIPEDGEVVAI